jgi:hypothetical protein
MMPMIYKKGIKETAPLLAVVSVLTLAGKVATALSFGRETIDAVTVLKSVCPE